MLPIRLNVGALIVRNEQLLLIECNADTDLHYNLPGGGVEIGEGLHEALRREVLEETMAQVATIGNLAFAWEYLPDQLDHIYGSQQKVALVFPCTLQPDSEPRFPDIPDSHQTGIAWIPLADLPTTPLLPHINTIILEYLRGNSVSSIITIST